MIGERFGNWVVEKERGRGAMGRVYLAREDSATAPGGRTAAIKVLAPELAQDPRFQQRFQREIEALRQLDHPNIIHFYEAGAKDGLFYYAMEYVDGRSLDDLLAEKKRLPAKEVLEIALQVSRALKHAHDHGIIHRDLKPSNLLRTDDGVMKLGDFGIAKLFAGDQLTATGGVIGTAHYLSPEQAAGKPVTPRSDFYSLGVVLYHLLTGRPPFDGESILDLLHKHRFAQFDSPRKLVPEVPHDVDELICQLLQKDPARRPPDGGVLARQIERLRGKLERQAQQTIINATEEATVSEGEVAAAEKAPGPATLMSRLMRQELEGYKYGGPVRRFFNQPIVLVTLFLLCVGTIVWTVWRPHPSADELFQNGARLMESANPADWEEARKSYFDPLNQEYPGHPYQKEVEEYLQRIDDHEALRRALEGMRSTKAISEGQRFYQEGLRRCQAGDIAGARQIWQNVVASFQGIEAEQRWVQAAERGLSELKKRSPGDGHRWDTVHEALRTARQLRDEGKREAAEKIWKGIEDLYRDDPAAQHIRDQLRRDRGP